MKRFKKGDQITIKSHAHSEWVAIPGTGNTLGDQPKFGKVYTFSHYDTPLNGVDYIFIDELHPEDSFDERPFELVVSDSVLASELESVPEPFTI